MSGVAVITSQSNTFVSPQRPEPQFNVDQNQAMSAFFERRLSLMSIKDWNTIPIHHPLWNRCITCLIAEYAVHITEHPTTHRVEETAIGLLVAQKREGNLKQFFCEHVLSNPAQIQDRAYHFIKQLKNNQIATYTCLAPDNPKSIAECSLLAQNQIIPPPEDDDATLYLLKDKLPRASMTDILFDPTFAEENVSPESMPTKNYNLDRTCTAWCFSRIEMPVSRNNVKPPIRASMRQAFSERTAEIIDLEKRAGYLNIAKNTAMVVGSLMFLYLGWRRV